MRERVGWLGLGALGSPMALNLLENGYPVTVFNRTPEKAAPLAQKGAQVAKTSLEAAHKKGIVVSLLWDSDATEDLVTPEFLARMEGGVHIGMFTGSPEAAQRLAALHAAHGSSYVEAPIFGRPEAAKDRQLVIPYAGPEEAKARIKPLLTAMGAHLLYDMGEEIGPPSVTKQLGNFLIISMGRSLSEGVTVANAVGVDTSAVLNILGESLFTMPLFKNYAKAVSDGKNLLSPSQIPAKDLGLFTRLAQEHAQPTPVAELLLELTKQTQPS